MLAVPAAATQRDAAPATVATRTIVQIVPPGSGGVRDHAETLRDRWDAAGLVTHLFGRSRDDARAQSLASLLERHVRADRRPCALLLHYSAYGYARRGVASWLLREVEETRRRLGDEVRRVVFFHELYASGAPSGSAFWLSMPQAWVASRMAAASDAIWTNSDAHASWLRERTRARDLVVRPVFSSVGEPDETPVATRSVASLVVFGGESTRRRALAKLAAHAIALRRAGVEEVVEIGSGAQTFTGGFGLRSRFVGRLDAGALSRMLGTAAFGLIDYPPRLLGKSSVFAAYAAHGVVALDTEGSAPEGDGLAAGSHFVRLDANPDANRDLRDALPDAVARQRIADAARRWYGGHRVATQAVELAALCEATAASSAMGG